MPQRMQKLKFALYLAAAVGIALFPAASSHGQAQATGYRNTDIQVGGYFVGVSPDYTPQKMYGPGAYATFDFTQHLGVEGNFRRASTSANNGTHEQTFELGGRYVFRLNRFNPYFRVSGGRGQFRYPSRPGGPAAREFGYYLYSFGGGLDYNLMRYLNLRADYEYQSWVNFPPNGIKPQAISVGVAYRFR